MLRRTLPILAALAALCPTLARAQQAPAELPSARARFRLAVPMDDPERVLASYEEATARPGWLRARGASGIRSLIREVEALDNPHGEGGWLPAAITSLTVGGVGAFTTFAAYFFTSLSAFGGIDQGEEAALITGASLSGASLVAGLTLLFIHFGNNGWEADWRAFEDRRHDLVIGLRDAYRVERRR